MPSSAEDVRLEIEEEPRAGTGQASVLALGLAGGVNYPTGLPQVELSSPDPVMSEYVYGKSSPV